VSANATGQAFLVWLQCAITIIGATIVYWVVNPSAAKSLAYGSCIVLTSTMLLAWRAKSNSRDAASAGKVLQLAYRTALERMAYTIAMLAVGFKLLNLAPFWMIAGFVAGQATWLMVPVWTRLKT
jgi:F0F1-type ATP synthase assembly protein I